MMPPRSLAIAKSIYLTNAYLSEQAIIDEVLKQAPSKVNFSQEEMSKLYSLSIKYQHSHLTQEELISEITNLKSGSFIDIAGALAIIAVIILLANNITGFQSNLPINIPPHL